MENGICLCALVSQIFNKSFEFNWGQAHPSPQSSYLMFIEPSLFTRVTYVCFILSLGRIGQLAFNRKSTFNIEKE